MTDDDMTLKIENVLRASAALRPTLDRSGLTFLERLELCGMWALMDCIEKGLSDADIAEMFTHMKARMLRQAATIRAAHPIAALIREAMDEDSPKHPR